MNDIRSKELSHLKKHQYITENFDYQYNMIIPHNTSHIYISRSVINDFVLFRILQYIIDQIQHDMIIFAEKIILDPILCEIGSCRFVNIQNQEVDRSIYKCVIETKHHKNLQSIVSDHIRRLCGKWRLSYLV